MGLDSPNEQVWTERLKPVASHDVGEDAILGQWMRQHQIDPRELEVYDFLNAMKAGATRDASGHWPSDFKRATHPNLVVGGLNTKTGERVTGAPRAKSIEELIQLGWEPEAAQRLWQSVKGER